jgi:lysophospholipase L1-like esterase
MNRKVIFVFSIVINILFVISFFVAKRMYYKHMGYINSHPNGGNDSLITYTINKYKVNKAMVDIFKTLPHKKTDVVLLGTSLTQGFPLQELLNDCRIKNRGIGGNTTFDILDRLIEVTDGKPSKIFLEAGTNDIGKYSTIDTPYNNIVEIANKIKEYTPKTKLYIQSILPMSNSKSVKPITDLNNKISIYCDNKHIKFIKLYPAFLKDGVLNKSLTTDGIHLNFKGYFIWKENIESFINE